MFPKLIYIKLFELYIQLLSKICEASVSCIKEGISIPIVLGIEPFLFQLSPNCFRNIQMRAIGREKNNKETSFLPIGHSLLDNLSFMHTCIVQYDNGFPMNSKRKIFQIFQNELGSNILFGSYREALTLPVNKSKAIQTMSFFRSNTYFFIGKLPAIRNISLSAYVRFISVKQVYPTLHTQLFQAFQLLNLVLVILRQRLSLWAQSYSLISSAKLFKKRRSVLRLTNLPLSASHSAFAACKRWRLALIERKMDSLSDSLSNGLRPCPNLLLNPPMPDCLKRLTQLSTLMLLMPVILPTSLELRPSDLSNITWQRLRKQWVIPVLNPDSNAMRSESNNIGLFTRPIMGTKVNYFMNNIN